ncbi:MAG: cation:proton antiporter [Thermoprotei archaeon]
MIHEHISLYIVLALIAAKLVEVPFRKVGLSPIPGYVIVGLILGSSLLGIIKYPEYLSSIAYLSLVLLMLYTGLTTEFRDVMDFFKEVVLIGFMGVFATFVIVYVALRLLGFSLLISIFVATALSNTATEAVAGVLARTRDSRFKSIIIGASFFDDILAVYLITLLTSLSIGEYSLTGIVVFTLKALAFIVVVFYISNLLARKYTRFYEYVSRDYFWFSSLTIVIAFALAFVARIVGLSELLGAYLAGILISRGREYHDPMLRTRVVLTNFTSAFIVFLDVIFLPLFFVYVGLSYTIVTIDITLYAILLLLALLGKFIGVYPYAIKVFGDKTKAIRAGLIMGARGSLDIALIRIGLDTGVIDTALYSTVLSVALTTAILVPIIYAKAYKI